MMNVLDAKMVKWLSAISHLPPLGSTHTIEHDGFVGEVIGYYVRDDHKCGVVLQFIDDYGVRNIVHVYGEKWLWPNK